MVHTNCVGFNGRTSDDLAKGKKKNKNRIQQMDYILKTMFKESYYLVA